MVIVLSQCGYDSFISNNENEVCCFTAVFMKRNLSGKFVWQIVYISGLTFRIVFVIVVSSELENLLSI